MRVVVLGVTGLLGRAVTAELARAGHHVVGVRPTGALAALAPGGAAGGGGAEGRPGGPAARPNPTVPVEGLARSLSMDITASTATELDALLYGSDAVVHTLGPDVEDRPPAPAAAYYQRLVVEPTVRLTRAATRQGVGHVIVLGSAYATFDRMHPEWRLATHHPYIQARIDQSRRATEAAARSGTAVSVLELPSVYGTLPGAEAPRRRLFDAALRRGPLALTSSGGSATVTHDDVGYAVAALVSGSAVPGRRPVATDNLSHRRLAGLVAAEVGRRARAVPVPGRAWDLAGARERVALRRRGLAYGLDPARMARDLLGRTLFLDTEASGTAWGLTPRPVDDAVRTSLRAAYPELFPGDPGDPGGWS